ncbi:helix-turn-helix protein [Motilibacter rhizosphaerae]|uniref:Helix-turn-helix protein n=1 Tax=Motilibacter rhizosphaerae TaxID=598652 RepID=A0A4Q7NQG6_9ACTN|nr:helix-turn-helix transcriptional regulator [Motilibacter rhizosphaerae]RZS87338.1 helix-turn-helix protein [Motilibacter rhizosphaerae]
MSTELGEFLRTRRESVRPEDVGLPAGRGRRTPGLRREEVASLAGLSVDYYTRLEQARRPSPSRQVLLALARALQLTEAERSHLLALGGYGACQGLGMSREVPQSILQLVDRLDHVPALVISAARDVLVWNSLAAALFGDLTRLAPEDRNLVWLTFVGCGEDRFAHADRPGYARDSAAELRAASGRYPQDQQLQRLVRRLLERSPEFAEAWARHEVAEHQSRTKRIIHREVGELVLDQELLVLPEQEQRLILLTAAPGSASYERLQLLRVLGTQQLSAVS